MPPNQALDTNTILCVGGGVKFMLNLLLLVFLSQPEQLLKQNK